MMNAAEYYRDINVESLLQPAKDGHGQLVCGAEATETFRRLLGLVSRFTLADPLTLGLLDKLLQELRQAPVDDDPERRGGRRLTSYITDFPRWASLVPFPAEPPGYPLDVIRVLILLALVQLSSRKADPRKKLALRVTLERIVQVGRMTRPTARTLQPILETARILTRYLEQGKAPDVDLDLPDAVTRQVADVERISGHLKALQHLLFAISDVTETITRRGVSRNKVDELPSAPAYPEAPKVPAAAKSGQTPDARRQPPPGPRAFHEQTAAPPGFNPADSGLARNDVCAVTTRFRAENVPRGETASTPGATRRQAASEYSMWLVDQCFPGSARVAATEEFTSSVATLRRLATPAGAEALTALNRGAILLTLSAITSRHWEQVQHAQRYAPEVSVQARKLYIDVHRGLWIAKVPELEDRWEPKTAITRNVLGCHAEQLHPWKEVLSMPLPSWLANLLRMLPSNPRDDGLFADTDGSAEIITELTRTLHDQVSPNVTPARLRAYLPARIIQRTGNLALAQALSDQSAGYSNADLYYWASGIDIVIKNYLEALEGFGPFTAAPRLRPDEARYVAVSRLALLRDEPVHAMVSRLRADLERAIMVKQPQQPEEQLIWRLNQLSALCAHTMGLSEANAGGRLTQWVDQQSIDDLSFNHFLIDDFAARRRKNKGPKLDRLADAYYQAVGIRRDKLVYPLNLSRVVAVAPLAVQQQIAWLEGLAEFADWLSEIKGLDEDRRAALLAAVGNALSGRGPVFLRWDGAGLIPATAEWLTQLFPKGIGDNFLRHRLSRRLVELGASPMDVSIHLGHHFIGAPFGNDSIDTPSAFSRRLGPKLDRYLRADGWSLLRIPGTHGRCWQHHLTIEWDCWTQHRADCRRLDDLLRQNRENFHRVRKESLARVDGVIEMVLAKSVTGFTMLHPTTGTILEAPALDRIILDVQREMDSDALREIAARRLRYWIQSMIDRFGWTSPLPGLIYQKIEPHDVISREHARATRIVWQVQRVLADEHKRGQLSPQQRKGWQDVGPATGSLPARFVASLVFDAKVTNQDAVLLALRGLPHMVTIATLPGVGIIPLVPAQRVVQDAGETEDTGKAGQLNEKRAGSLPVAGRTLALALALRAALLSETESDRPWLPSMRSELAGVLTSALPREIRAEAKATWDTYAEIVEMSQRMEVAGPIPLSRRAGVSSTLPHDRLVSLLLNQTSAKQVTGAPARVERTEDPVPGELNNDLEAYSRLVSALGALAEITHAATRSRATNTLSADDEVAPHSADSGNIHTQTILELSSSGPPNVRPLARFASHLLTREAYRASRRSSSAGKARQTKKGKKLAASSAHSYVTRIGRTLLRELDGRELAALDEEDITCVLRAAIFSKSISEQRYTYDRICEFYRFIRKNGSIARISLAEIVEDLPDMPASCEAAFVTRAEFATALEQLRIWWKQADRLPETKRDMTVRLIEASATIMTLMYRLGLRIGEARRLRFDDIIEVGQSLLLRVHSNQLGNVKSFHSNRVPDFALWANKKELRSFAIWRDKEKDTQGIRAGRGLNPIFSKHDDPLAPVDAWRVNEIITEALREATGDPNARPHWLRHSRAMNWLSPLLVPCKSTWGLDPFAASPLPDMHPAIHGLWICRQLGHSRLSTSLHCYEHLRRLAAIYRQVKDQQRLTTAEISRLASIDPSAVRQRCEELNHKHGYGRHWHHAIRSYMLWRKDVPLRKVRPQRRRLRAQLPFSGLTRKHLTLGALLDCIGDLQRKERLPAIQRRYGLTRDRLLALLDNLMEWHIRTRYWLVPADHLEHMRQELGAKARLATDGRRPAAAPLLQLGPVRELLEPVALVKTADWRKQREQLHQTMELFRDDGFVALTVEQRSACTSIANLFGVVIDGDKISGITTEASLKSISARHFFSALLVVDGFLAVQRPSARNSDTALTSLKADGFQL